MPKKSVQEPKKSIQAANPTDFLGLLKLKSAIQDKMA